MNIILNGKPKVLDSSLDLKTAIDRLCTTTAPVIAELNGEIVKTPQWEKTTLHEGDRLELISFVGGG